MPEEDVDDWEEWDVEDEEWELEEEENTIYVVSQMRVPCTDITH